MYKNEKELAAKAEQMLETSLRRETKRFARHVKGENKTSIREATAVAKTKKYGLVREGTDKHYIRKLSVKIAKHGIIQHYGVNTIRRGGKRTRKKPYETTYRFRHHRLNIKPTPFIDKAIKNSGVVPFLLKNITKIRSEEILVDIVSFLEE